MLYLLDYGAGNVASLANSVRSLGYEFKWVQTADDIEKADRILFPGVGAFGSAMAGLRKRGFVEPLKAYIASGRPYMGICIGMQALFESSLESDEPGLAVIPAQVGRFSSEDKKVPCMGWNGATERREIGQEGKQAYGLGEGEESYYFVHSFRVDANQPGVEDWALTLTQYGEEKYVSSVQRGNVFGTQFHPEKSGKAGLAVVEAWLKATDEGGKGMIDVSKKPLRPQADVDADLVRKGFTKRIVACLDVRANDQGDLVVTKGDQYDVREAEESVTTEDVESKPSGAPEESASTYPPAPVAETTLPTSTVSSDPSAPPPAKRQRQVRNLGKPVDLARRYYAEGADEVAFLNITSFRSCPLHDQPMLDVVRQSAETVFVPLTIGGGIRDSVDPDGTTRSALEVAGTYFRCGADKVSIGSDAVFAVEELLAADGKKTGKTSIETISYAYGAQAVVVSFDPKRVYANSIDEIPEAHRPCAVDLAGPLASAPDKELKLELGPNGERYCWYQCTVRGGRETRDIDVVQLAQGVEKLGAGEILLNSVDKDGSKSGFDCRLVELVRRSVGIPVVASSGAGKVEDFSEVFEATGVEAALAAGIFHRKEVPIDAVKKHLVDAGIKTRRV
ncbi:glutamine amidotransferase / cyclase [Rhodotorula toruloides]|uniref:Imidazole glycerol phosphate synthase hisHF n=1 Tax=Rhodotorula toruloides TaxID=5286 RepID=A0A511KBP6_RHOTO|nr:glutamine amidotransferase / cyclase [Rhodotorula toruloides]